MQSAIVFVAEKKVDGADDSKKGGSKKGMDIFAADDDMFSENYSHVSSIFMSHFRFMLMSGQIKTHKRLKWTLFND